MTGRFVVIGSLALVATSLSPVKVSNSDLSILGVKMSIDGLTELAKISNLHHTTWISPFQITARGEQQIASLSSRNQSHGIKGFATARFEYAEHTFLGDGIGLTDDLGLESKARDLPIIVLGNETLGSLGLSLTYGQICALAGDFYGTKRPISDGKNETDRRQRFMDAFDTLASNHQDQPKDARALLDYLQTEINQVSRVYESGQDSSTVYRGDEASGVSNLELNLMTSFRKHPKLPSYGGLAEINWDHFGDDARIAYATGHAAAVEHAANGKGSKKSLFEAYAMNAFADHYLQDLFSAGHMRTPRRVLHGRLATIDLFAKYMHDEDSALGLRVTDTGGESWMAYGDRRLLDRENHDNLRRCQTAVYLSAQEVWYAWKSQRVLPVKEFNAWKTVPTKASALAADQALAPLFLLGHTGTFKDLRRRKNVEDRKTWTHTDDWTEGGTYSDLLWSTAWKYPMTM